MYKTLMDYLPQNDQDMLRDLSYTEGDIDRNSFFADVINAFQTALDAEEEGAENYFGFL